MNAQVVALIRTLDLGTIMRSTASASGQSRLKMMIKKNARMRTMDGYGHKENVGERKRDDLEGRADGLASRTIMRQQSVCLC